MPGATHRPGPPRRRRLLTRVVAAVKEMDASRGCSAKQILGRINDDPDARTEIDKSRLVVTLKKGVEAGTLTYRSGRYRLKKAPRQVNELCCRRRRRRSCTRRRRSCRRRRRSCRRRRRSCRRRRRRSCRRRRRSCRRRRRSCRRRRRSCRRRRRSCRRRRPSCRRRRRRSCRRRRRQSVCCRRRRRRSRSCRRRRRRCSSGDALCDSGSPRSNEPGDVRGMTLRDGEPMDVNDSDVIVDLHVDAIVNDSDEKVAGGLEEHVRQD